MQDSYIPKSGFNEMSNEELVLRAQKGDGDASSEIVDRLGDIIKKCAGLYEDSSLEYDDLLQEGRLACFYAIGNYNADKGASFRTYAAVCINNRILNFIKSKSSKKMITQSGFTNLEDSGFELISEEPEKSPENILISNEQYKYLKEIIKNILSPLEYKVFCCILDDMSYEQTACTLGQSVKSVDNAMQRIRKKLKNILE